jgi:hypothetical protein
MGRLMRRVLASAAVVAAATAGIVGVATAATPDVIVTPGDFSLTASPATQTVVQGKITHYGIIIRAGTGFTSLVTLSVKGLPANTTASFSPNPAPPLVPPATRSSTLTITTSTTTPVGNSTLTISGTGGGKTHAVTVTLSVVPPVPDFTISASPLIRTILTTSKSGSYGITIRPKNGFTSLVTLSDAGVPVGATSSFSVNPAPPSTTIPATSTSKLTIVKGTAAPGTYTITITGTSGALKHSTTVTLVIQ